MKFKKFNPPNKGDKIRRKKKKKHAFSVINLVTIESIVQDFCNIKVSKSSTSPGANTKDVWYTFIGKKIKTRHLLTQVQTKKYIIFVQWKYISKDLRM